MKNSLLLAIILLVASCNSSPAFRWLDGTWVMKTDQGMLYECWERENASAFKGQGFFVNTSRDTLFSEQLRLVQEKDSCVYIATVKDQNGGVPVSFRQVSDDGKTMVFENPAHDFPQRIVYIHLTDTSMDARIEGIQHGNKRVEVFHFIKQH